MKRARIVIPDVANLFIFILTTIIIIAVHFTVAFEIATHNPDLWIFLCKEHPDNGRELAIMFIIAIITVIMLFGLAITIRAILVWIANHILQFNVTHSTANYPRRYYVSSGECTDDDRRNSTKLCYQAYLEYRNAYTVSIEFTSGEMWEILHYMQKHHTQYYELPKSFLMPDNVSWLQPRISLHTVNRIMRELKDNGVVLLEYKYSYPRKGQIERSEDKIRIQANLHQATYTSTGVFIGSKLAQSRSRRTR